MGQTASDDIHRLAEAAGLQCAWRDVEGRDQIVAGDALARILEHLGYETGTQRKRAASLKRALEAGTGLPPLVVTEVGTETPLPTRTSSAELTDEQGVTQRLTITDGALAPVALPGYYDLVLSDGTCRLAVAPAACPLPAATGKRLWGTSLQIPSLRGTHETAFGGLGELSEAVLSLAQVSCQAVAINPVHALFPGVGDDFSPYSPSSRTFLNTAIADPALLGLGPLKASHGAALVDWPSAMPDHLAALRESFAGLSPEQRARIAAADGRDDPGLSRHALHEALFCHFRAQGARDWRDWPARFRSPDSAASQRFAEQHADEIAFHLYGQWLAREGLSAVQDGARAAGMSIGLIADLAVGVRPYGSDCWAMPGAMLSGLTIGAPPDPLGPLGQNWSITGFSPEGLRSSGYAPWIAMLRSALRSAGGLRIDHAFGLARLWVIPEGGECADGAYLTYPFLDLARLVTLEAHRAEAMIIAEDLGTAPPGFTSAVTHRNMLGMRVLWFERAEDHGFIGAHDYPANCVAMTGTHDTPTVAGWWSGRDLAWAEELGRLPEGVDRQKAEEIRDWDRGLLWSTIGSEDRPAADNPDPAVHAALAQIGKSPAVIAIAPIEDLLAQTEQPNLPGTTSGHPNWRIRQDAPLGDRLREPGTLSRIAAISCAESNLRG
ncbi:4-alpha-glucanotransferase [Novosphingobium sp.]|uniref:4-alpha-glucanotransferase n=1 Tax=Novosphingobium sp. TaxID=1874826 RepID=UPI00286E23F1|nr:4-alpha-glucanotransferase [Novosphingobium sp.]